VIGRSWWYAAPPYDKWRSYRLPRDSPGKYWWHIRPSNHYGTVLLRGEEGAFTVQFDDQATSQPVR